MIITPPFTEAQKRIIEATEKLENKCDIDGIDDITITNFDRITANPEALATFVHEAESMYERCAKGDLNCDYCECKWCGLAGRKDLIDWLKEEYKNE